MKIEKGVVSQRSINPWYWLPVIVKASRLKNLIFWKTWKFKDLIFRTISEPSKLPTNGATEYITTNLQVAGKGSYNRISGNSHQFRKV